MCEYCDFYLKEKPYSKEKTLRGKLIIDDCDVSTYLEKECYDDGKVEYYITSTDFAYGADVSEEIKYCPMCGRELKK